MGGQRVHGVEPGTLWKSTRTWSSWELSLLLSLTSLLTPSLKISSALSVMQWAGFLQEEASLCGDKVVTDINQAVWLLSSPFPQMFSRLTCTFFFSRDLNLDLLVAYKPSLSKANSILKIGQIIKSHFSKEISMAIKISAKKNSLMVPKSNLYDF